jgi:tetratricopeptide (TPR) repeat protein
MKSAILLLLLSTSCYTLNEQDARNNGDKHEEVLAAELAIAENFLSKGEPQQAWQNLRPLLQQFPERTEVLTLAGLSLLALQNNQRGALLLEQAYKLKSTTTIGLNLSSAYISLEQYQKAQDLLLTLLAKKEPYSYRERLWHNLALIYDRLGDEERAIATYQRAIQENPTYYLSHLQLAEIYHRHPEKKTIALQYFTRAHRFCPDCFEPIKELVEIYTQERRTPEAVKLLQDFLQIEETSSDYRRKAQELLQEVRHGDDEIFPLSLK